MAPPAADSTSLLSVIRIRPSVGLVDLWGLRAIKMCRASGVLFQAKPHEYADRGRERHGNQQADKAEQVAEGENGEDDPDGAELDPRADEIRCQHVVCDGLADKEDTDDSGNHGPVRPELKYDHAHRCHKATERTDIWDEADQPRCGTDQEPMVQSDRLQRCSIEQGEYYADCALTT